MQSSPHGRRRSRRSRHRQNHRHQTGYLRRGTLCRCGPGSFPVAPLKGSLSGEVAPQAFVGIDTSTFSVFVDQYRKLHDMDVAAARFVAVTKLHAFTQVPAPIVSLQLNVLF